MIPAHDVTRDGDVGAFPVQDPAGPHFDAHLVAAGMHKERTASVRVSATLQDVVAIDGEGDRGKVRDVRVQGGEFPLQALDLCPQLLSLVSVTLPQRLQLVSQQQHGLHRGGFVLRMRTTHAVHRSNTNYRGLYCVWQCSKTQ